MTILTKPDHKNLAPEPEALPDIHKKQNCMLTCVPSFFRLKNFGKISHHRICHALIKAKTWPMMLRGLGYRGKHSRAVANTHILCTVLSPKP